jgi:hypothetical protein
MYLNSEQVTQFTELLKAFFTLPYSTDLDGKDAETLLRIVKNATGVRSKRKELFDIVDGDIGYSVKTLRKTPRARHVDLQEQRFCQVTELEKILREEEGSDREQGRLLLEYMRDRLEEQMTARHIKTAKSLILLKWWDDKRTCFQFRYWEEDFLGHIDELWRRNQRDEIEWVLLPAGIHARDKRRRNGKGKNVRLLRMHPKHNQIFTDHEIPEDAISIEFQTKPVDWLDLTQAMQSAGLL